MRVSLHSSIAVLLIGGGLVLTARAGDPTVLPPPAAVAPLIPGPPPNRPSLPPLPTGPGQPANLPPAPVAAAVAAQPPAPAAGQPPAPACDPGMIAQPAQDWLDGVNRPGGYFDVGTGFYLLKPYFSGNPAFTFKSTVNLINPAPGAVATTQTFSGEQDFDYQASVSPLIWLGYTGASGLGVRARWWHFDQGTGLTADNSDKTGATTITSLTPHGISFASPGRILELPATGSDQLAFDTDLKIDNWDFEVTQAVSAGKWGLLLSGGVRYAHLAQNYHAYRFNSGPGADVFYSQDSATLISGHNFTGAGPTLCLEAKRWVGNTGLALYANARGSLLFGRTNQQVDKLTVVAGIDRGTGPFNSQTFTDFTASQDRVLPVAELELGGEYAPDWCVCRRFHPFLRAGLVGQTWFGAGNASGPGSNLGLLGMSATAGVEF